MNPQKTVFISSTYKDLAAHRQKVWEKLKDFDVAIRGMEEFGARSEGPLETCLTEVDQSDIYVVIVAFRLGSLDAKSNKSFTQLEYEQAATLGKEILVYIAAEDAAVIPFIHIDSDQKSRTRLTAFKTKLRQQHTVATFSTPDDLADKLSRDFKIRFPRREPEVPAVQKSNEDIEFDQTVAALREFRLVPKKLNGYEVRLNVKLDFI